MYPSARRRSRTPAVSSPGGPGGARSNVRNVLRRMVVRSGATDAILRCSCGSVASAYISGIGRSIYLSIPVTTPRRGAHPRPRCAVMASKYAGRSSSASPAITRRNERPARLASGNTPRASSTVGTMSTCRTGVSSVTPRGASVSPGTTSAMSRGTRSVASYAKMPCVSSPCSPRLSP